MVHLEIAQHLEQPVDIVSLRLSHSPVQKRGDRLGCERSEALVSDPVQGDVERTKHEDRVALDLHGLQCLPDGIVIKLLYPGAGRQVVTQRAKAADVQTCDEILLDQRLAIGDQAALQVRLQILSLGQRPTESLPIPDRLGD